MENTLEETITIEEIETTGLKDLGNGWLNDDKNEYIQLCDETGFLDDGSYNCHYEILRAKKKENGAGHYKDNVYVEIHIEDKKLKKHFDSLFQTLTNDNKDLEIFNWYCTGIRFKNREFDITKKDKILETLKELKQLTLTQIICTFLEAKNVNGWHSSFSLTGGNRNNSDKRERRYYSIEEKNFEITHEKIKGKLISEIKSNPKILDEPDVTDDPIDLNTLSPENIVNEINYIDLAAKTQKGNIIFFEIKTKNDARLCIREALGQLMEYSYFPKEKHANKLVVVGPAEKTNDTDKYIQLLNNKHNIPITYLQIRV